MRNFIFVLILGVVFAGCVPAKKFTEVELGYKKYYAKSKKDDETIAFLREQNSEYMMKKLSLERDTMRLFYSYNKLYERYNSSQELSSIQLANSQRQLKDKSSEVAKREQNLKNIEYALRSIDFEVNSLYRGVNSRLQRHSQYGVQVSNLFWNITVSVPDDVMYEDSSCNVLTAKGESIIATVLSVLNESESDKFDIEIRELSRYQSKTITKDSVVVNRVKETILYEIPNKDSLAIKEILPIEVEVDKVSYFKIASTVEQPAAMTKGSAVAKHIEKADKQNKHRFTGVIYLNKPKESLSGTDFSRRVDIVIRPNFNTILSGVNKIKL